VQISKLKQYGVTWSWRRTTDLIIIILYLAGQRRQGVQGEGSELIKESGELEAGKVAGGAQVAGSYRV